MTNEHSKSLVHFSGYCFIVFAIGLVLWTYLFVTGPFGYAYPKGFNSFIQALAAWGMGKVSILMLDGIIMAIAWGLGVLGLIHYKSKAHEYYGLMVGAGYLILVGNVILLFNMTRFFFLFPLYAYATTVKAVAPVLNLLGPAILSDPASITATLTTALGMCFVNFVMFQRKSINVLIPVLGVVAGLFWFGNSLLDIMQMPTKWVGIVASVTLFLWSLLLGWHMKSAIGDEVGD